MKITHGRLRGYQPGEGAMAAANSPALDDTDWISVDLPVGVHTALHEAGKIPHPYGPLGEKEVAWVATQEWWYRASIPPLNGPAVLRCQGLDGDAEIWVNGQLIGQHRNSFRPYEADIADLLHADQENLLAIRFAPVVDDTTDVSDVDIRDTVRIGHRKMQVAFGWDISCYLLTLGISHPIELTTDAGPRIASARLTTIDIAPDRSTALVRINADIAETVGQDLGDAADYELIAPDGASAGAGQLRIAPGSGQGHAYQTLSDPALWWTHDLGSPDLYTLKVTLRQDGRILDEREIRAGVRTVELDQAPDQEEPGARFFRFRLNGTPIFARGANWVPEDLQPADVPEQVYRDRVAQAAAANMNMLRIWGGGAYEPDAFYDACDEAGILVWQDFMFAGLPYPNDDEQFLTEAAAEARHQVTRLAHHACLALWCGNNEAQRPGEPEAGLELFSRVLPEAVEAYDGTTPYWPGSPYGGPTLSSLLDGDVHDWRGFHGTHAPAALGEEGWQDPTGPGRHWKQYATGVGRFVSEFGFAAPAMPRTIQHWMPDIAAASPADPDRLAATRSAEWQDRIRYVPGDSHQPLLDHITGQPSTTQQWLDYQHLIQAEGIRFGIERFRQRKPHCSGALLWQLNDSWPGFTWSLIDFDGRLKPAYYAARRAYTPALATIEPLRGGAFEVWAVNDTAEQLDDTITVTIFRFDGTVLHREELPVSLPPGSAASKLRRYGWGRIIQPRSTYATLKSASGHFPMTHQIFADPAELELLPADLDWTVRPTAGGQVEVGVTSPHFVPMVAIEHPEHDVEIDDNYFALHPGETRTFSVSVPADETRLEVRAAYP